MKKQLVKIFNIKKISFLLLAFIGLCSFQVNAQQTTVYSDAQPDGLWATVGNWDNGLPIAGNGDVANLTQSVDLGGVNREIGQLLGANNTSTKTYSNGTLTLNGTTVSNTDQIIRIRSNKAITVTCDVVVNVDGKDINIRNNASSRITFDGGFAIGANTVHIDNNSTASPALPVQFNGAVTGSGTINIEDKNISTGASADFSGFTGSITFDGTNALLTINGANTIEGSIGVLATADGNSKIEFMASQTGLANLSVDTQALAIDFDAAATAVEFTGYTTSGTEGVVDLQNYVSGSLKIGTTSTSVDSAILDTWTVDGAAANLVQDASGNIIFGVACTEATDVTSLAVSAETTTTIDLGWVSADCFDEVLVVAKSGSAVLFVGPSGDGTTPAYTANAAFGTVGTDTNIVTDEFAVYKGSANTVSVTGLTTYTDYHFKVYTRKGSDWSDGVVINEIPNTFTTTSDGTWETGANWVDGAAPSTATDNIIINHNMTINSDVTVNDFSIIEASNTERVTVAAGFSLTVNGDAVTKHQLIANSTATSFASLIFSTTGSTTQNIAYNRYINSNTNGNDLISSPVPDTFSQIQNSFYANPADATQILFGPFDNTTAAGTFTNWDTDDNNGNLVVGKGYRAASDAGSTVQFKDAITSPVADIPVSITDGNHATYGEWNLIGNPYPSYLNFGTFFTENSGEFHLDNVAVYGWNGSSYTVWNGANSSDKLAPGQGFFVRTKDGVSGTVTFTPAMRTTGNSNDFVERSGNNNKALAKINLSKLTKTYSTNVYFIENQTKGLDFGYDAGAFSGSATGIYTNLVEDNTGLALGIQSLPYNDYNNVVVPVVINSESGVELKISLDQASLTIPENTYVYLKDNLLNTTTLLNDVDYLFTPDTVLSGAGRFFVEFSANILATDEFAVNEMLIYTNHATKSIIIKGLLKTDANAKVFDIQGRMVLEQKIESSNITNVINVNSLNTGVYIVKLESRTQKIIIK